MPFTNFPYGVTSFGIPVVGPGLSIPSGGSINSLKAGTVWFVDTTYGSDGNVGTSPQVPLKTIGQAVSKAQSGTGDTIFVFPGTYAENVVVNKDYIAIIGAQQAGYARPDITPASGVPLTVTGQGFLSSHCRYGATAADAVDQQGNGFFYTDCVFDGDGTANKAGVRLVPSNTDTHLTASEGQLVANYFRGNAFGIIFDTATALVGVGSTDNWITQNRFSANTIDIATADTGSASTYSVQVTIIGPGNIFEDKNKTCYIDLTTANGGAASAQTGTITGNEFATDSVTTTNVKMVGTGFTFVGNFDTVGVVDGSGLD